MHRSGSSVWWKSVRIFTSRSSGCMWQVPPLLACMLLCASILPMASCKRPPAESNPVTRLSLKLPQSVGVWSQTGAPQLVGPQDIFNYMDGGGELYLGFRFNHLEVQHYASPNQGEILVELYWMNSSDDAYGLLSGDWGGEAMDLVSSTPGTSSPAAAGGPRALYGSGLLRLWSGNLFARVMADHETSASKSAVQSLGQAIVAGRAAPPIPELIQALPSRVGTRFFLRPNHVAFLRSPLVLNSVYFLSSDNLLELGPDCEMATTTYGPNGAAPASKGKPVRLMLTRYKDDAAAEKALQHFRQTYLPDKLKGPGKSIAGDEGAVAIEDGWMGFARSGRGLVLVFEAPDEDSAKLFLGDFKQVLVKLEASHDRR
jgi:hypothetical protein